jgi:hypothetical protein
MWRLSFCLPEPTHAPSLVQVMAPEKRKQIECGSGNERDQVRASLPSPSCLPRVLTTSPRPMYLRQARAALASDVACKLPRAVVEVLERMEAANKVMYDAGDRNDAGDRLILLI